ncbi:Deleted in malignant brain tumors 1 protein [Amphibalanus amphitrite]|uniref:Deleted in malignant brain tumors 1 protein n=1 Tax=Amphibalanus amphitrite TaxID=1232801 RepID=A0A6A4W9M5_AMPAM|nr:Deleted in malignant brain tumors 1 protein [Amphibalanus amphitrite]
MFRSVPAGPVEVTLDSHPLEVRGSYNRPVLGCSSDVQTLEPGAYIIHSPNFDRHNPQNYTNDYTCTYQLRLKYHGILRFDCFDFQLEDSDGCSKDRLKVTYGSQALISCGRNTPRTLYGESLDIDFTTDSSGTDTGFLCTVMSKVSTSSSGLFCGRGFLEPGTYSLVSLFYPDNYGTSLYCRWDLSANLLTYSMEFSCRDFDMVSWDGSCEWDYLEVNGKKYCNGNPPPGEDSPLPVGQHVEVVYETPDLPDKTRKGFNCTVVVK